MELEENIGWKEEEEFHRQTAIKRSQIRIAENRETAIDILAINIIGFKIDTKHHHKIMNPIDLINKLPLSDLAFLLEDINEFIKSNQSVLIRMRSIIGIWHYHILSIDLIKEI